MVLKSVIFGLLAALALGVSDLVAVPTTRKLGVLRVAIGVHVVAVAASTVYLLLASSLSQLSATHWAALFGLSVLGVGYYLSFYKALQLGPVAIVTPVVSAYAVVAILLAVVFLGERLTDGQALGIAATIGGVALSSVDPRGMRSGGSVIGKGVLFALAATLGLGLWSYSLGVLSREIGWFLPVYVIRLFIMSILAPVSIVRREWPWRGLTAPLGLGVVVVGILEIIGLFAFARGTEVGVISIVAAASTTSPIVPMLGGLLIFRERLALSQVAGLAVALGGILVLGLNS